MKLDLTKIDTVEFLNELGMMKIKRDGNEVTFSCPFGLHMRGGAISMRDDTTQFSCFGCGAKGNALTFLEELEDIDVAQAIKWLGERWDISRQIDTNDFKLVIKKRLERSEKKKNTIITPVNSSIEVISILELDNFSVDWDLVLENKDHTYLSYMLDRGFTSKTLNDWEIGWDEIKEVFTIPYFDYYGNLIGFKGRALPGVIPKYKAVGNTERENRYNFKTLESSNALFAIDRYADSSQEKMILCEGELNCISMYQDGFINTVGISGQYLSDKQIELVKKYTDHVVLIFDEWDKQVKIAEQLRKFISVSVSQEHDKDPADMTREEKQDLLSNCVSGLLVK